MQVNLTVSDAREAYCIRKGSSCHHQYLFCIALQHAYSVKQEVRSCKINLEGSAQEEYGSRDVSETEGIVAAPVSLPTRC